MFLEFVWRMGRNRSLQMMAAGMHRRMAGINNRPRQNISTGNNARPANNCTAAVDDDEAAIRKIIGKAVHKCPGCGAHFHMHAQNTNSEAVERSAAGYIPMELLRHRLTVAKSPPYLRLKAPQQFNPKKGNSLEGKPLSKFAKDSLWWDRAYTRMELERIHRRFATEGGGGDGRSKPAVDVTGIENADCYNLLADASLVVGGGVPEKGEVVREDSEAEDAALICERCHGLQTHNKVAARPRSAHLGQDAALESTNAFLNPADTEHVRTTLNNRSLILLVIDLTDLPASIPTCLHKRLLSLQSANENAPDYLIVGNKLDLVPKHERVGLEKRVFGMVEAIVNAPSSGGGDAAPAKQGARKHLQCIGIHCVAAKGSGLGIAALHQALSRRSAGQTRGCSHIFMYGHVNVGKSMLFNRLLSLREDGHHRGRSNHGTCAAVKVASTVSRWSATTQGIIKAPFAGQSFLHDMPGILTPSSTLTEECSATVRDGGDGGMSVERLRRRMPAIKRRLCLGERGVLHQILMIRVLGPHDDGTANASDYTANSAADGKSTDQPPLPSLHFKFFHNQEIKYTKYPNAHAQAQADAGLHPQPSWTGTLGGGKQKMEAVFNIDGGIGWFSVHTAAWTAPVKMEIFTFGAHSVSLRAISSSHPQ